MSDIELIVGLVIKLYIIVNAVRLGWDVEVNKNELILTKKNTKMTSLDYNTKELIGELINDSVTTNIYDFVRD